LGLLRAFGAFFEPLPFIVGWLDVVRAQPRQGREILQFMRNDAYNQRLSEMLAW
jgi:hypothetical protein